jgi:predicted transcriptional regulator
MPASPPPEAFEELQFLVRSPARLRILRELSEDPGLDRRELDSRLEVSRTTVSRNLDRLVEREWVEEDRGTYRATPCGELLATELTDVLETVERARQVRPFFQWVSTESFDLGCRQLRDADVVVSTPGNPYAPVDRHVDRLSTARRLRCVLPVTGRRALETVEQAVRDGATSFEVVVAQEVAASFEHDDSLAPIFEGFRSHDRIEVFVTDAQVPYYLGIVDDVVQVGVGDDDGVPRALVESNDEAVREWAAETYRRYRESARPLD